MGDHGGGQVLLTVGRRALAASSVLVAPSLLGAHLVHGAVRLRITEVEAYLGELDPGSHAFRGRTPRTEVMYGEPGRLYAYVTYGMHTCLNVVCSPVGTASAVLVRAGEIVEGVAVARMRRPTSRTDTDLASGPARLAQALGVSRSANGTDLLSGGELRLECGTPVTLYSTGPRTGVSGDGGSLAYPWRYWIPDDPTVSPYRPHVPRRRPGG